VHPCYLAYREQVLRESGPIGDGSPSLSPLPGRLQLVRGGPVAPAMLRALDRRIDVVVTEIPRQIRGDRVAAARAQNLLATLEATRKLGTPATVGGAIRAALASVSYQPPAFTLSVHQPQISPVLRYWSRSRSIAPHRGETRRSVGGRAVVR
jgi:hypothetical protein